MSWTVEWPQLAAGAVGAARAFGRHDLRHGGWPCRSWRLAIAYALQAMRRRACIATRIRAANARETGFRQRAEQAGKRGISDPFKQSSRVRGIARAPPRAFALRAIEPARAMFMRRPSATKPVYSSGFLAP
ncbi:hypothetical protein ABIE09_003783 [Lysobacter enzymogenes]|uniref:hypothetical protein n=1 Tax=Lysobacter enzymogenes TaxID=69 RepID=UPI003395BACC